MTPDRHPALDRPLVSIGVPVRNGAQHLVEAIESALAQSYAPLEVVVSDNASTDATEAIVRRYLAVDGRVRYVRNPVDVGVVENFRRVLMEARGTYFTWLSHDDLLAGPEYISTVVEYLERHPDVVGCMTDLYVLNTEVSTALPVSHFPELDANRPWTEARRGFFTWPQIFACGMAIFAVFRRETLTRVPPRSRAFRGRLTPYYWEMPVLAALCGYGRIVALPRCLRTFRMAPTTLGQRLGQETSPFDLVLLGLGTKLRLLRCAWRSPLPLLDRLDLSRTAFANLFRANVGQPVNLRWTLRKRQQGLAVLRASALERSAHIRVLRAEIERRRAIVRAAGRDPGVADDDRQGDGSQGDRSQGDGSQGDGGLLAASFGPADTSTDRPVQYGRRRVGSLLDLFRPPSAREVAAYYQVNKDYVNARKHCDDQLSTIEHLHHQAESLLDVIRALQDDELRQLRSVFDERSEAIGFLRAEVRKRRELVQALDPGVEASGARSVETDRHAFPDDAVDGLVEAQFGRPPRGSPDARPDVPDGARLSPARDGRASIDLAAEIEQLRRRCDEQLRTMERLQADAESLLEIINRR
jgi:hypothetical protein